MIRWLFVCSGNVCRSPLAEAVARVRLEAAGLGRVVTVESAGLNRFHQGEPPDPRAIATGARRGYVLADQRARPVVAADFGRCQRILAMDQGHLEQLQRWAAQLTAEGVPPLAEITLLLPDGRAVPDPYFQPDVAFEAVLTLIEPAVDALVADLAAHLPSDLAARPWQGARSRVPDHLIG